MGPDVLGEIHKPKRNLWIEKKMENDTFGEDNAGMDLWFLVDYTPSLLINGAQYEFLTLKRKFLIEF